MKRQKDVVKAMVIGAGKDSIHALCIAKEQGIYTIAVDAREDAEGFAYADESQVLDINDYSEMEALVQKVMPDFLIPVPIGSSLLTLGHINELFDLKGVRRGPTELCIDKYLFRKKMQELFPMHYWEVILVKGKTIFSDISISYPAVLKPRFGSGSRDVYYCSNEEDLEMAITVIDRQESFVLEPAFSGVEYGVDGFVISGELFLVLIRKKLNTPLPIRQAVAYMALNKAEYSELYTKMLSYLKKVVSEFSLDMCMLHADVMIDDNKIELIEMAPRPSGHYVSDIFVPFVTDIDMSKEFIRFLKGEEAVFVPQRYRSAMIRFFDFENVTLKKVPSAEEVEQDSACRVLCWKCFLKKGDYLGIVINGHSIMNRGFFIVEGMDEKDCVKQCNRILSKFDMV